MKIDFKYYRDGYYNDVCDFLISINQDNHIHINWNWARWEWMYYHPLFKKSDKNKIGLWFSDDKIVGMATYDQYLGEGFFVVKVGFEQLEQEIINYAIKNLRDDNGFSVAANDADSHTIKLFECNNFTKSEEDENLLEIDLTNNSLEYTLEDGFWIKSLNEKRDVHLYNKLLWLGFDHGEEVNASYNVIRERETMLSSNQFVQYRAEEVKV